MKIEMMNEIENENQWLGEWLIQLFINHPINYHSINATGNSKSMSVTESVIVKLKIALVNSSLVTDVMNWLLTLELEFQ